MKKIFFAVAAIAALTLTSCNNSTSGSCCENDSTCCDSITIEEPGVAEAVETVQSISSALQSGNAEETKSALEKAQAYIEELIKNGNAEKAAQYASQIKQFVNDHKSEIDAIASGNETLAGLVSAISSLPTTTDEALNAISGDASTVKEAINAQASDAVENIKDEAKKKVDEKVQEAKDAAKDKASKAVDDAANAIKGKLGI